jgi:hypothetical protein
MERLAVSVKFGRLHLEITAHNSSLVSEQLKGLSLLFVNTVTSSHALIVRLGPAKPSLAADT